MNRNGSNSTQANSEGAVKPESTGTLDGTVANNGASPVFALSKRGGPRTPAGKLRTRHNALKHGIFADVALLKGESQAKFNKLWRGLRDDFKPVGIFEERLVEILAVTRWRQRRLLISETADIEEGIELVGWDAGEFVVTQAAGISDVSSNGGLIRHIENPLALRRCLELLGELKDDMEKHGFDPRPNKDTLRILFGNLNQLDWATSLFTEYTFLAELALIPDDQRIQNNLPSPETCVKYFLKHLSARIKSLKGYQKLRDELDSTREQLETQRRNFCDSPRLDRWLRYSASLERTFDRTLSQLERAQAMRRGQPVLAPIKVDHSST